MSYLIYKHGAFWFQIHVPNALVPRYGKFIRQNLQTTERSVAQPIALQLAGQWLSRFSTEKMDAGNTFNPPPVETAHPQTVAAPLPVVHQPGPQEFTNQHHPHQLSPDYGYSQPTSASQAPGNYGYPSQPSPPQLGPAYGYQQQSFPPQPPQQRIKPTPKKASDGISTMEDLLQYWRRMRPDLSKSTYREVEAVVKDFKKTIRKRPADLVRVDIAAYRDKLIDARLARATVGRKISFIATLLQTAYDAGHLSQNVARGLRIPKSKITEITRRSFTAQELKRIFTSPVYTKKKRPRACGGEAIVWVPLIALATGARLEEICQLRVADIYIDSEHGPLLRITDEGEGQTLKTSSSRRIIPIHLDLIGAGLLDYHEAVSEKGHDWLFPELEPDHDGRRGGTFGQGFSRYLRSNSGCCIIDRRVVFHSFRHSFKTLCRESGLSEELHDALTGHAAQTVGRSYGHMPLSALVEAVARIRFPVEFPRIES